MPKPTKAQRVDVIAGEPANGLIVWFELNEVDTRLLAKGLVSSKVREQAQAAMAWADDDPVGYVDEDFLKTASKTTI